MPTIDSTSFGKIVINGRSYKDVLIINDRIFSRNYEHLKKRHGTSHVVSEQEVSTLLQNDPEFIIIGTGQYGVLKVDKVIREKFKKRTKLIITTTPDAIKEYNQRKDRKVNALFHTTC